MGVAMILVGIILLGLDRWLDSAPLLIGGLLLVGVGALMLRVIFWVDWFRR